MKIEKKSELDIFESIKKNAEQLLKLNHNNEYILNTIKLSFADKKKDAPFLIWLALNDKWQSLDKIINNFCYYLDINKTYNEESLIMIAAKNNKWHFVEKLMYLYPNINQLQKVALFAASEKRWDKVDKIIKTLPKNSYLNEGRFGGNLLWWVCHERKWELANYILHNFKVDIESTNNYTPNRTPFYYVSTNLSQKELEEKSSSLYKLCISLILSGADVDRAFPLSEIDFNTFRKNLFKEIFLPKIKEVLKTLSKNAIIENNVIIIKPLLDKIIKDLYKQFPFLQKPFENKFNSFLINFPNKKEAIDLLYTEIQEFAAKAVLNNKPLKQIQDIRIFYAQQKIANALLNHEFYKLIADKIHFETGTIYLFSEDFVNLSIKETKKIDILSCEEDKLKTKFLKIKDTYDKKHFFPFYQGLVVSNNSNFEKRDSKVSIRKKF